MERVTGPTSGSTTCPTAWIVALVGVIAAVFASGA
jgi:hypothetical protein